MIDYKVRIADPRRHVFEVDCCVSGLSDGEVFELPSWIPGSYLLREYARHVIGAVALDAQGHRQTVEKIAHNAWYCPGIVNGLTLRLHIYALDESVRGAWLDVSRAFFNGPCLFARPRRQPDSEVRLMLEAPRHAGLHQWRVATAMTPLDTDARGFGTYTAEDYDELLDQPFEIGEFDRVEFRAQGIPHSLVVAGRHDGDLEKVAADLRKLCSSQIRFFGEPPPFDRYVFLCAAVSGGYGGLEHRFSSSLMFHRDDLPRRGEEAATQRYQKMLSLASHEYFHAWHVKRTMPAAFVPYRLDERNHTRLLWVFEGITSYYQDRFLLRSGLLGKQDYLRRLAEIISNVWRVPGRHVQSLAEASFDAWDKHYKPEANSPNAGISYYTKGAIIALALDLEIRLRHDSRVSIDTVVQALWREFGAKEIGLPEDGFETLTRALAGEELAEFFDYTIRGTEDPPLQKLFSQFGIDMRLDTIVQRNGGALAGAAASPSRPWLGIVPKRAADGVECVSVLDDGPAQAAGMNPGDVIVALDRRKASLDSLDGLLGRLAVGADVVVSAFRGDELLDFQVRLDALPPQVCSLAFAPAAGPVQIARRDAWLYE